MTNKINWRWHLDENGNKVLQYRQEDLEEFENSWNNLSDEYKQQLLNAMGVEQ